MKKSITKTALNPAKIWRAGIVTLALTIASLGIGAPTVALADGFDARFFEAGEKVKLGGAWLGVQVETVTAEVVSRFGLDAETGVYVSSVVDASAAEEAGVRPGDVIVEYNYQTVTSSRELAEYVAENEAGDEVILFVNRDGNKKRLVAQLNARPTDKSARIRALTPPEDTKLNNFHYRVNTAPYIGVSLQSVSGQLADYFATPGGVGVLIVETIGGSPAEEAGLKAGDVVIAAAGQEIEITEDLQRVVRERQSGDKIEVTVIRNKRKTKLSVTVAERQASRREFGAPRVFAFNDLSPNNSPSFEFREKRFNEKILNEKIFNEKRADTRRHRRTLDPLELPDVLFSRTEEKNLRIDLLEKQIKELKEQIENLSKQNNK